jgi:hypothetical protein
MKLALFKILACFTLLLASYVSATKSIAPLGEPVKSEPEKTEYSLSGKALQAFWVFSGIVTNESGETYNYYFQIQRKDNQLYAIATLIDGQSKEVLLFEEANTIMEHPETMNWRVGRAFMKFNPINDSWVFGLKTKAKKGFNFKVDMLKQETTAPTTQDLRKGIGLLVTQTGQLNGHLQLGETSKEQFVTAPKAWFKQVWVSKPQTSSHLLRGVLCQFNNGSGFYAVNLQEADALHGAVAGWLDLQGTSLPMSQFVSIKKTKEGSWCIRIPSPKVRLSLQDLLAKQHDTHQLIAGITEGLTGFCTISQDEVGQQQVQFAKFWQAVGLAPESRLGLGPTTT